MDKGYSSNFYLFIHSVYEPSPWEDATHIQNGSSHLN